MKPGPARTWPSWIDTYSIDMSSSNNQPGSAVKDPPYQMEQRRKSAQLEILEVLKMHTCCTER